MPFFDALMQAIFVAQRVAPPLRQRNANKINKISLLTKCCIRVLRATHSINV